MSIFIHIYYVFYYIVIIKAEGGVNKCINNISTYNYSIICCKIIYC